MTLRRVIIVAAAFIILGILTVWQHVQLVQVGRRIRKLEADKAKLSQEYRKLKLKRDEEKSPNKLLERAKELGLDVGVREDRQTQSGGSESIEQNQTGATRD
jgi:cell division protein FtsL